MAQRDARPTAPRRRAAGIMAGLAVAVCITALAMAACRGTPTPPPTAAPSPTPTTTPDPRRAMNEAVFTISLGGQLLGVETLRLGEEAGALIAFSELVRADAARTVERRTVVLSELLNPLRYDLEIGALGARSIWVGQRNGDTIDVLNNNLAWFGPVLVEDVTPAPEVMLESVPSALPYALLALRDFGPEGLEGTLRVHALNVLEDLPVSRALTVTVDVDRQGAVIGTVAVEGHLEGAAEAAFTMWARPGSRALYSVELPGRRASVWEQQRGGQRLWKGLHLCRHDRDPAGGSLPVIRWAPGAAGGGGGPQAGHLCLGRRHATGRDPRRAAGLGPFPVRRAVGPRRHRAALGSRRRPGSPAMGGTNLRRPRAGRERRRVRPGSAKRGGRPTCRRRSPCSRRLPGDRSWRVVVLGLDVGGPASALSAGDGDEDGAATAIRAAVLAALPGPGPIFPPDLALRIRAVLAPYYGWGADETARYGALSVTRWQEWLFEVRTRRRSYAAASRCSR